MDLSATTFKMNQEAAVIEHKYLRQQAWKHISICLTRGVRDQTPGFNKAEQEVIPASWSVAVEGRPKVDKADDDMEGEQHEDAICMCCFDGTSVEGNRILFCDGCNAALHQVCYGVKQIPEGDFFCDRCVYIKVLAKELQISGSQVPSDDQQAIEGMRAKTAAMCCLCPLHHGGLKPTTDGRWVHLCCALWSRDSIITDLSDMSPIDVSRVPVQLPGEGLSTADNSFRSRDRRVFLSSKLKEEDELFMESFSKHCTLSTIERPCMYCALNGGYMSSCSCADTTDGSSLCSNVFHPLCAWFEGAYMKATITDQSYQGLEREGLYPSGVRFTFLCIEHSNMHDYSQRAPPAQLTCGSNVTEEQHNLRSKYRINEDDLEQIPGQNKRRRKKAKRKERNSVSRAMGASATAAAKDLTLDVYGPQFCASCMDPITCDPFQCGYDFTAPPQWEVNEYVVELMNMGPSSSASSTNGLTSTIDYHHSNSNANKTGETVIIDSSETNPFQYNLSEMTNSRVPVSLPNGTVSYAIDVAVAHHDPIQGSSLGDEAKRRSGVFSGGVNYFACCQCGLHIHKSCFMGQRPVEEAAWCCDVCSEANNRGASQESQLIHVSSSSSSSSGLNQYQSNPIVLSQVQTKPNDALDTITDIRCCLCPRRGGYFRRTTDHKWAHPYCATMVPGNIKFTREGMIDIRFVPKESRKEKCFVCNRKNGLCRPCSVVGCPIQFHPICGARSGKALMQSRMGERTAFCCNHIPESVEKLPSGHWIDGYELERFRYSLDRARLIIDILVRREKYKKMLCKAETELLSLRFNKLLDKAKRRKPKAGDSIDLSDLELNESDDDVLSDDDDVLYQHLDVGNFIPIIECPIPTSSSSALTATSSTGNSVSISARWVKRDELRLPRKVFITFAGLDVERKDIYREGGNRMFTKHFRDILSRNSNALRKITQIFSSETEEQEFARLLGIKLRKHMNMELDELLSHLHINTTTSSSSSNTSKGVSRRTKGRMSMEDSSPRGGRGRPKKSSSDDQLDATLDLIDVPELTQSNSPISGRRKRRRTYGVVEVINEELDAPVVVDSELPVLPHRTGRSSRSTKGNEVIKESDVGVVVDGIPPSKGSSRKRILEIAEATVEVVPSSRPRRNKHVTFSGVDSSSIAIDAYQLPVVVEKSSSISSSRSKRNLSVESSSTAASIGRSTRSSSEEPLEVAVTDSKKRSRITEEAPAEVIETVTAEESLQEEVDDDDDDDDVELDDDIEGVITVDEPFEGDIREYFMTNNEAAVDASLASTPFRFMTKSQLREELESDDLCGMMLDDKPAGDTSSQRKIKGFGRSFKKTKISRSVARSSRVLRSRYSNHMKVSYADEWKVYGKRELFRLERRLQVRPTFDFILLPKPHANKHNTDDTHIIPL